jgi:hypothetical protein
MRLSIRRSTAVTRARFADFSGVFTGPRDRPAFELPQILGLDFAAAVLDRTLATMHESSTAEPKVSAFDETAS